MFSQVKFSVALPISAASQQCWRFDLQQQCRIHSPIKYPTSQYARWWIVRLVVLSYTSYDCNWSSSQSTNKRHPLTCWISCSYCTRFHFLGFVKSFLSDYYYHKDSSRSKKNRWCLFILKKLHIQGFLAQINSTWIWDGCKVQLQCYLMKRIGEADKPAQSQQVHTTWERKQFARIPDE